MSKSMRKNVHLGATILMGAVMALLMVSAAFAATTPPIRSGEYKTPTRSTYEFQGWYLNPEGTGDMVIDKNGNWLVDLPEDTEVFAKWKQPPTILLPEQEFNLKLKKLSGQSISHYTTNNTTITSFKKAPYAPDVSTMTSANILSTTNSAFPVYAWFDNGTIWWYSDADTVEMNPKSNRMFYSCKGLISIDVSGWDTSNVTNMDSIFYSCSNLTSLDVSGWDTSNVTNMDNMFNGCSKLTGLDVSGFDTSKVTTMKNLFNNCSRLTSLDINDWDTSNVTNMSFMFGNCSTPTNLDISGWDTTNVTDMSGMFYGCSAITSLDVSRWNTSNVTNMSGMFRGCSSLTGLDVSGFDTSNVTTMTNMFYSCSNLANLNISGWDTSNVTTMESIFYSCSNLTNLDVSGFDTSKVTNMSYMFYTCSKLTILDLSSFDTSNVTNMYSMFQNCTLLTTIYASELWNTDSVTLSRFMFSGCTSIPGFRNTYNDKRDAYYGGDGLGYLTYKAAPTTP